MKDLIVERQALRIERIVQMLPINCDSHRKKGLFP